MTTLTNSIQYLRDNEIAKGKHGLSEDDIERFEEDIKIILEDEDWKKVVRDSASQGHKTLGLTMMGTDPNVLYLGEWVYNVGNENKPTPDGRGIIIDNNMGLIYAG